MTLSLSAMGAKSQKPNRIKKKTMVFIFDLSLHRDRQATLGFRFYSLVPGCTLLGLPLSFLTCWPGPEIGCHCGDFSSPPCHRTPGLPLSLPVFLHFDTLFYSLPATVALRVEMS